MNDQTLVIQNATDRIRQMERLFDALLRLEQEAPEALRQRTFTGEMLEMLTEYYESGQWLHDYELDENGCLPQDLKRGVLAQDAVFDFLNRFESGSRDI